MIKFKFSFHFIVYGCIGKYTEKYGIEKTEKKLGTAYFQSGYLLDSLHISALIEYKINTLKSCDSNAILFSTGVPEIYHEIYVNSVLKVRSDVIIVDRNLLDDSLYLEALLALPRFSIIKDLNLEKDDTVSLSRKLYLALTSKGISCHQTICCHSFEFPQTLPVL
jgi:hypothetical protein